MPDWRPGSGQPHADYSAIRLGAPAGGPRHRAAALRVWGIAGATVLLALLLLPPTSPVSQPSHRLITDAVPGPVAVYHPHPQTRGDGVPPRRPSHWPLQRTGPDLWRVDAPPSGSGTGGAPASDAAHATGGTEAVVQLPVSRAALTAASLGLGLWLLLPVAVLVAVSRWRRPGAALRWGAASVAGDAGTPGEDAGDAGPPDADEYDWRSARGFLDPDRFVPIDEYVEEIPVRDATQDYAPEDEYDPEDEYIADGPSVPEDQDVPKDLYIPHDHYIAQDQGIPEAQFTEGQYIPENQYIPPDGQYVSEEQYSAQNEYAPGEDAGQRVLQPPFAPNGSQYSVAPAAAYRWLDVPYAEKEEAKEHGARWDPRHSSWYAPNAEPALVERWGRKHMESPRQVEIRRCSLVCFVCGASRWVVVPPPAPVEGPPDPPVRSPGGRGRGRGDRSSRGSGKPSRVLGRCARGASTAPQGCGQAYIRIRPTTIGVGPRPPSPLQTKATIVGKNEVYNRENLVGPFLVHKLLGPRPPPPLC